MWCMHVGVRVVTTPILCRYLMHPLWVCVVLTNTLLSYILPVKLPSVLTRTPVLDCSSGLCPGKRGKLKKILIFFLQVDISLVGGRFSDYYTIQFSLDYSNE